MSNYPPHTLRDKRNSKTQFTTIVQTAYNPSPALNYEQQKTPRSYWRSPKRWSRQCCITTLAVNIICLVILIVAIVLVKKARRYPDYSTLKYQLVETYSGTNFFDKFNYFYGYDPAQGFVHYANPNDAKALNLTYASSSSAILRVDNRNVDSSTGRLSARVESKSTYDSGLFVFDIKHVPFGCSLWPALWLTDPSNWPMNGEIDVVEGTNTIPGNQVTLHTTSHCTMNVRRKETGAALHSDCNNSTDSNAGCGVQGNDGTFGPAFNAAGGGVYAMELRDAGIRTWFFPRSSIPSDLVEANLTAGIFPPDPSSWPGHPLADFPSTECDISSHFKNQSIIANIDLCGQWAGLSEYFSVKSGCPGSCTEYVSTQSGSTYDSAYWEFGGWYVFQAK